MIHASSCECTVDLTLIAMHLDKGGLGVVFSEQMVLVVILNHVYHMKKFLRIYLFSHHTDDIFLTFFLIWRREKNTLVAQ